MTKEELNALAQQYGIFVRIEYREEKNDYLLVGSCGALSAFKTITPDHGMVTTEEKVNNAIEELINQFIPSQK